MLTPWKPNNLNVIVYNRLEINPRRMFKISFPRGENDIQKKNLGVNIGAIKRALW